MGRIVIAIENIQDLLKINYKTIDSLSAFLHYDSEYGNIYNIIFKLSGDVYCYQSNNVGHWGDATSFTDLWVSWRLNELIKIINSNGIVELDKYNISKDGVVCSEVLFGWNETSIEFDGANAILTNDVGVEYSINYIDDEYGYIITYLLRPDSYEQIIKIRNCWLNESVVKGSHDIVLDQNLTIDLSQHSENSTGTSKQTSASPTITLSNVHDFMVSQSETHVKEHDIALAPTKDVVEDKNNYNRTFWGKITNFLGIKIINEKVVTKDSVHPVYGKKKDEVVSHSLSLYTSSPSANNYCVYHIYENMGDFSSGYIGVTSDFEARKHNHFTLLKNRIHENRRLQYVFDHRKIDENNMVVIESGLTESEAYQRETTLRPNFHMGWNINKGGKDVRYRSPYSKKRSILDVYVDPEPSHNKNENTNTINLYNVRENLKEIANLFSPSSMAGYLKEMDKNNEDDGLCQTVKTDKRDKFSNIDDLLAESRGNPFEVLKRVKDKQQHRKK